MKEHDPRDLEWQRRYEQNDTPWDKGAPAPALVQYLASHPVSGRVLVPGCGRGHEVRTLAAQADCFAVGLDLSAAALAEAARLAAQAGLDRTLSFQLGDFFQLPPEMPGSFDWLVEHTCFCAIEPAHRPAYVRSAASALRPSGRIFGIFYLDPGTDVGPPFAVSKAELDHLFAPSFKLVKEWIPTVSFPGRENRELVRILQKH